MSDLTDEEIIATRKLHGLNDDLFKKEKKINKQEKELNDLDEFADLLRPEQRYYTNIIKKGKNIKNKYLKWILIIVLLLLPLLIGISRIYLGVHYFSDVVGGMLLAIPCVLMLINLVEKNFKEKLV